jgi:hypothetical protein
VVPSARPPVRPSACRACQGPATHVLIVTGLSGEPEYATSFAQLGGSLYDAAKTRWGVADSNLIYLAENPAADGKRIRGKATREAIQAALAGIAARARPNDLVTVFLIGHGSEQADQPKLSLPGPDLSPGDLAAPFAALDRETVVLVNMASASGGFLPAVSGPRRIVITATKSGFERNATRFGEFFVKGLAADEADGDKDGRVSIAEAYTFARREVGRLYSSSNRLQTEHAQIDDNGDRKGSAELGDAGDGGLARSVSFALVAEPVPTNPEVAGLVGEKRRLEAEIAALKARKAQMDSTAYGNELERLLLALAETNQAIRAAEGKKP